MDKYAVCIRKSGKSCETFRERSNWYVCKKIIFFFLKGGPYLMSKIIISERRCNLGDIEGLQVLCKIKFVGQCKCVDLL